MNIKDQWLSDRVDEIVHDEELSDNQKRVATGKALREAVTRLKGEDKTVAEIADLTGMRESRVCELTKSYESHEQSIIWFPGVYSGREGDYAKFVMEFSEEQIISLVQQRAKEDGEWAIETGHVGDNEDIMRKMMAWVSNEKNIRQAIAHLYLDNGGYTRTVDWLCRDLANAAKRIGGSSG
jgi:hypothetical protein